jgi:transposase
MTMTPREERGLIIAAKSRHIKQKGKLWQVPSQQDSRYYLVNLQAQTCTCLDHQEGGHKCKHIYAAQFVYQREFEFNDDGTVTETQTLAVVHQVRTTYPQDWTAYNTAQTNEKSTFQVLLHDLCKSIPEAQPTGGRPRFPTDDAIFAACFKVFTTVSGRRCISDLCDAQKKGYIRSVPHFNSIFKVFEQPETTAILTELVAQSAAPLKSLESTFAVDSSGFSGCRFDRWYDEKWGDARSIRSWVKAHAVVGVKTNVITAIEVTDKNGGDCPHLQPLMNATLKRFTIKDFTADMAYLSEDNLSAIVASGANPLIPFKSNSAPTRPGIWNKMFHYFNLKREEFMAKYHQRSNIESTFSMLKRKFGDSIRSKTDLAMKNEVLAKALCHNLCCVIQSMEEFGIDPNFGCTQSNSLAHKVAGI